MGLLLTPIKEHILLLICSIHSLADPEVKAKFHPDLKPALGLESFTANELLSRYHVEKKMELSEECKKLQIWLAELKNYCYRIIHLSSAMLHDFYSSTPTNSLIQTLFPHCRFFDSIQMKAFIRTFPSPPPSFLLSNPPFLLSLCSFSTFRFSLSFFSSLLIPLFPSPTPILLQHPSLPVFSLFFSGQ